MEKSRRRGVVEKLIGRKSRAEPDDFPFQNYGGSVASSLPNELDAGPSPKAEEIGFSLESDFLCLLNDCRRQVWSDVARNGDVVRQRLVAASHQARGATPPDSHRARDPEIAPARDAGRLSQRT
jgi:hypothetical protein